MTLINMSDLMTQYRSDLRFTLSREQQPTVDIDPTTGKRDRVDGFGGVDDLEFVGLA